MNDSQLGKPVAIVSTDASTIVAECNGVKRTFIISAFSNPIVPPINNTPNDLPIVITSQKHGKIQPVTTTKNIITSNKNIKAEPNIKKINIIHKTVLNNNDYYNQSSLKNRPLFPINSTSINGNSLLSSNLPSNNQWNFLLPTTSSILNINPLNHSSNMVNNLYNFNVSNCNFSARPNLSYNSNYNILPYNVLSSFGMPLSKNINQQLLTINNISNANIFPNCSNHSINMNSLNLNTNKYILNDKLFPQTFNTDYLKSLSTTKLPTLAPANSYKNYSSNISTNNIAPTVLYPGNNIRPYNNNNINNLLIPPNSLSTSSFLPWMPPNQLSLKLMPTYMPLSITQINNPISEINISNYKTSSNIIVSSLPNAQLSFVTSNTLPVTVFSTTVNNNLVFTDSMSGVSLNNQLVINDLKVSKNFQQTSPHLNYLIQTFNEINETSQLDSLFDDIDNVLGYDNDHNYNIKSTPISSSQNSINNKENITKDTIKISQTKVSTSVSCPFSRPPPSVSSLIAMKGSRTQKRPKNDSHKRKKKKRIENDGDNDDSESWKPENDDYADIDSLDEFFMSSGASEMSEDSSWLSDDSVTIGKNKKQKSKKNKHTDILKYDNDNPALNEGLTLDRIRFKLRHRRRRISPDNEMKKCFVYLEKLISHLELPIHINDTQKIFCCTRNKKVRKRLNIISSDDELSNSSRDNSSKRIHKHSKRRIIMDSDDNS